MGTFWMTGVPANVCMVSLIASVILMYNSNVYEGVIQIALVHLISYVFASLLIRFLNYWLFTLIIFWFDSLTEA